MSALAAARSLLFAPAADARVLAKARASAADACIADLEDAVAAGSRAAARATLADALAQPAAVPCQLVRVNALHTADADADLRLLADVAVDGIVVPKATAPALRSLHDPPAPIVALIESAAGLRDAYEIAELPDVVALMIGTVDLAAELGLRASADGRELLLARSTLVLASAAAGLRPPIDGVCVALRDADALAREARAARDLGFGGKACIHPSQLAPVHEAFTPTAQERAWAQRVLEAYAAGLAAGEGVAVLDGEMVDAPVAERARRLLAHDPGAPAHA